MTALFCVFEVSVKRIFIKFWTTSRFILKQLDYSLSISMRDSWLRLRPHQLSREIWSSWSNCLIFSSIFTKDADAAGGWGGGGWDLREVSLWTTLSFAPLPSSVCLPSKKPSQHVFYFIVFNSPLTDCIAHNYERQYSDLLWSPLNTSS